MAVVVVAAAAVVVVVVFLVRKVGNVSAVLLFEVAVVVAAAGIGARASASWDWMNLVGYSFSATLEGLRLLVK